MVSLTRFHGSWAFGQLNTMERILLGRRGDPGPVARHVGDVCDLSPRDPDAEASWFRAALGSRGLADQRFVEQLLVFDDPDGNRVELKGPPST